MRPRKFGEKLLYFLLTIPVLLFIFFPILWLFSASLSTQVELYTVPPHWVPQQPTFQNYLDIFFPSQATSAVPRTFAAAPRILLCYGDGASGATQLATA